MDFSTLTLNDLHSSLTSYFLNNTTNICLLGVEIRRNLNKVVLEIDPSSREEIKLLLTQFNDPRIDILYTKGPRMIIDDIGIN